MIIQGNDFIVMADGVAIAASKSCSLSVKANTIETSSPDTGNWRNYISGRMEWSASATTLVKAADTRDTPIAAMLAMAGKTHTLTFKVNTLDEETLTGKAVCTDFKITATRGNLLQGSFNWKGTGPLA